MLPRILSLLTLASGVALWSLQAPPGAFHFAIVGDRTGEAQPGVFEEVWKETVAGHPAFVISAGDSIQGLDDARTEQEWREFLRIAVGPPLYLTAGNHDVWSAASEAAYRKHSGHALLYSFDYEQAHFTILDSSRSDSLSPDDLAFLESDLKAHAGATLKMVVSHRPAWLVDVAGRNRAAPLQRLCKQYGVRYVIAGHLHQLVRFELDGVTYLSMPSAGGHLRLSGSYADGWFFGHALVNVHGGETSIRFEEVKAPIGEGRVTPEDDWGVTGLVKR